MVESSPAVEQGTQVDVDCAKEAAEHIASPDRALKRPKIEKAGGSKSPPYIATPPLDRFQEVALYFAQLCYSHLLLFKCLFFLRRLDYT